MAGSSTDRRQGLTGSIAYKVPCKAATTANITLSGEQTIDGVSCTSGDRVLVKNQTTASQNGIYDVSTSTWTRSKDWNGSLDIKQGTAVRVTNGTENQGVWYVTTANDITIGTTNVSIARAYDANLITASAASVYALITIDSSNVDDGYTVSVEGFYAGDNLGMTYSWNSSANKNTANGGTIIDPDNIGGFLGTTATLSAYLAAQGGGTGSGCWVLNYSGDINVKWFGAKGDDSTDDTTPLTSALAAAVAARRTLYMPGGTTAYVITDQITIAQHTNIRGDHWHMGSTGGTRINFTPSSAKSLFVAASGALKDGYSIEGLVIVGNSASAAGNSIYAFDIDNIIKSRFSNIRIYNFRTGIRCFATIMNRFEFVHVNDCHIQNILYDGGIATTDVWDTCYIINGPIGIQTNGASVGIRFVNCIIESITTYGVNLVKEVYGWQFVNTYSEDVPNSGTATDAMFRVGYDGTTLAGEIQLIVSGGYFGGRNAGASGSLFDIDYTDGVILGGFHVTRYTNVVKTSSNTQTTQVITKGWTSVTVTNQVTDVTKITGYYGKDTLTSGSRNRQNAIFSEVAFLNSPTTPLNDYREYTSTSAACTGAITTAAIWKVTKIGNQVTLTLPNVTGTASAAAYFEFGEALGAAYRPSAAIAFPCLVRDNGAHQAAAGYVYVTAAGAIRVYKDLASSSNFTAATDAGLGQGAGTSVSWTI